MKRKPATDAAIGRWLREVMAYPDDAEDDPDLPSFVKEPEGLTAIHAAIRHWWSVNPKMDPPQWVIEIPLAIYGTYRVKEN